MDYIRGANRNQVILFPESVEDYITEENPAAQIRLTTAIRGRVEWGQRPTNEHFGTSNPRGRVLPTR